MTEPPGSQRCAQNSETTPRSSPPRPAAELDGRVVRGRVAAGLRRADRRPRDRDHRRAATACSSRGRSRRSHPASAAMSRCACARATGAETAWSEPLRVEAGFLAEGEWVAQPIGLADPRARRSRRCCAPRSRSTGRCARRPALLDRPRRLRARAQRRARSRTTCSRPAGPATATASCTRPTTSPRCVREGENVLGATLAGGWYTEKSASSTSPTASTATQPSFLAQLRVDVRRRHDRDVVATGDGWHAFGDGPDRRQRHLRRRAPRLRAAAVAGWSTPGFDARPGAGARRGAAARPRATARPGARGADRAAGAPHRDAARRRGDHDPLAAARILDFGQNLVGRLRLRVRRRGRAPRSRCATPRCWRTASSASARCATPQATDRYILARRRRRDLGAALHLPRLPLRRGRRLAGRARPRRRRGRRRATPT